MYKLKHFVAKHRTISKIIITVAWAYLWLVGMALTFDFNIVAAILCFILCTLAYWVTIDATPGAIMHKPLKELFDKCDPYPFLEETEKLLTYKNSKSSQLVILMNHAVALSDTGEYQAAYDVQKSVNIDNDYVPINKAVYYHNLFEFCMNLEKYEEAGIWYEKFVQVSADVKGKKQVKMLKGISLLTDAEEAYRKGEYMKSIELANSIPCDNLRMKISGAMIYSRACIALGEKERAAEALGFVIKKGNRLHCVTEAAAMLREIRGTKAPSDNSGI